MKKIKTKKAPAAIGPYSQAVVSGNIIFTSGQIAIDPKTNKFIGGNIVTQTKQVIENLKAVLEAAGTDLNHVLKTTVFLVNFNDYNKMNEVYAQYFTKKPARSTVEVSSLPKGALIEIECFAVIPQQ